MVFVVAVSALSLAVWIIRAMHVGDRVKFVRNHLKLGDRSVRDGELVRKFTRDYLKQDGSLILRLIAHNTDNMTTTDVICALWDAWKANMVVLPLQGNGGPVNGSFYPDMMELRALKLKSAEAEK